MAVTKLKLLNDCYFFIRMLTIRTFVFDCEICFVLCEINRKTLGILCIR